MKRGLILWTILLGINITLFAQQQTHFNPVSVEDSNLISKVSNLFTQEASYIGDITGNIIGGKKTGAVYLGMANIKIGFETKNLGLWEGGEFFINGAATHGSTPSEKLFGDFQVASNIEAGNHTYLHELWYKHSFEHAHVKIGLQDLNAEFVTSEFAGSFINSSFGIPSLIADNIPVPIFPLTALGISSRYELNESIVFQAALFDGLPESFENNQFNVDWNLNGNDGLLVFTELQYSTNVNKLPGVFKAGYYYHSHLKETCAETGVLQTVFDNNYGFYLIADQLIYSANNNSGLGLFAQFALSPGNINMHNYYIGGGINYSGLFDNNGQNELGFAFANAGFNCEDMKNETTIEIFYKTTITENLFIQPDIQYIINPVGTGENLKNAIATFIRFGIDF